jgi:hypothetical protein
MKRYFVVFHEQWKRSPMSFWVHIESDNQPWYHAKVFNPPLPPVVPGKEYPYYYVEVDGFVFEFASLVEMDVCIRTLGQRNLPSTEKETTKRGTGSGLHWLSKLPGEVLTWRYRQKAVKYLHEARANFERQIAIH